VNIRDFATVLRRNLMVALLLVCLTMLGAMRVLTTPPVYQARTVVTFLAPPTSFPRNSYASFTPDLTVMAEVATRDLSTSKGRAKVRRAGGTADYEVVLANRGNQELPIHDQPYLNVLASSRDPAAAGRTLKAVVDVMRTDLTARQVGAGATPSSLVSWKLTAVTSRPVPQTGQPTRALAAVAILGVLGTVGGTLLADRFRPLLRRTRRGPSSRGSAPPAPPAPPDPPDPAAHGRLAPEVR
jgi:hypothetical protein